VGIQIGLTLLSMVVTRSSALSLQAKQGLPRGNQITGWIVLGAFLYSRDSQRAVLISSQSRPSSCHSHTVCNQTTTTCTGFWSSSSPALRPLSS
jgi:phosphatidylinositol glycan class N